MNNHIIVQEKLKHIKFLFKMAKKLDPQLELFFDTKSTKYLDDKLEVLEAIMDGKTPKEIGLDTYEKILEKKPDNVNWDM